MILNLNIDGEGGEPLNYEVRKLLLAGYTFRDQEQIKRHVEELKKEGIAGPNNIPAFCPKLCDRITAAESIEVLPGIKNTGEAEYVLLMGSGEIFIGIGSDHSDRETEKYNMWISKQLCPCVISKNIWRYRDVEDRWDNLIKRSWVEVNGQRELYQEIKLDKFMRPEELIEKTRERVEGDLIGTVIFAGTEASLGGEFIDSPVFEAELVDEEYGRKLTCSYTVRPFEWFKGEIL